MPQDRRFTDDLPSINISRLRATDVITPETTEFLVKLGDVEQTVGVYLRNFPNGGSWSLFIAPCCGKKVRMLRLLNGRLRAAGAVAPAVCCTAAIRRALASAPRCGFRSFAPCSRATSRFVSSRRLCAARWSVGSSMKQHLQRNLLILRRHELAALAKAMGKAKD